MGRNGPSAGMHELCLGVDEEPAKSLRVVTSGQTTMVHVVGVCYRPPDPGKWVMGPSSHSWNKPWFTGLGPHGGLQRPWYLLEEPRSGHRQSWRRLDTISRMIASISPLSSSQI